MLNEIMDSVVLVKGWGKKANWSFPRGKINKDELDLDCAVREVYEETGYDIKAAGLVVSEEETKYIEVTMKEKHVRLYIFRGVPMDTHFEPRTRKEISEIGWYKLSQLPTIKKTKQLQGVRGEDLALNANKYFMVAPFLVPLKKWIAAQRKLDKAKEMNGMGTNAIALEDEPAQTAIHGAEEGAVLHSSNEDLERLLDSLRQSAEPRKTSDLPEVSGLPVETKDITAQLKSVLGVPPMQPLNSTTTATVSSPIATHGTENQDSNALLALLRGKPPPQAAQIPQTPSEQVLGSPPPPSSPHPHHQPPGFSSLPPPPAFPFSTTQDRSATTSVPGVEPSQALAVQAPQPPQVRSIPPPQQPAQFVSRISKINHGPIHGANTGNVLAPYQRTGDPQFAQNSQVAGTIASSIPPASKLPPPKLTAQSSILLNLFKSKLPSKTSIANGDVKASGNQEAEAVPAKSSSSTTALPDISNGPREAVSLESRKKPEDVRGPTGSFVPHQTLSKTPLAGAKEIDRPTSEHQDKLLSLFRTPSGPAAEPVDSVKDFLQPPSGPVELSAQPMTPGHSREPSKVDTLPKDQVPRVVRNGSMKAQKRPRQDTLKGHNPPVSATVNGPLNVPQFDMLAKVSQETKHPTHDKGQRKSPKKSPVTILSRQSRSYTPSPASPSLADAHDATAPPEQQKTVVVPRIETLISPIRNMPPTPDLKGRPAPLKPFHPQILRRPAPGEDPTEPSPIQPLPSPRHTLLANRTTQPTDHKKSLLSLFTKPSPLVSPAATAPSSAIDPASVVSPLSEKPTTQQQADVAFAQITRDIGALPREVSGFPSSVKVAASPSRTSSVRAVVAGGAGGREKAAGGKKAPTPGTTPVDRSFLLGYLEGVANGGR